MRPRETLSHSLFVNLKSIQTRISFSLQVIEEALFFLGDSIYEDSFPSSPGHKEILIAMAKLAVTMKQVLSLLHLLLLLRLSDQMSFLSDSETFAKMQ